MKKINFLLLSMIIMSFFIVFSDNVKAGSCCDCDPGWTLSSDGCCYIGGGCPSWACRELTGTAYTNCYESGIHQCSCNCNNCCDHSPTCNDNGKTCGNFCTWTGCSTACDGGCTGCDKSFKTASLTVNAIPNICITQEDTSRDIRVTGNSNYCGDITIQLLHGTTVLDTEIINSNTFGSYAIDKIVSMPLDFDMSPEPTNIKVKISGNRESISESGDSGPFNCERTLNVHFDYKNAYYCPKKNSLEGIPLSIYDLYTEDNSFIFSSLDYASWDECVSLDTVNDCSPNPTDCVDKDAESYPVGTAIKSDSDNEYEYCYSREGVQGGWIDPDIFQEACDAVDDLENKAAEWLDCSGDNNKLCDEAIDDNLPIGVTTTDGYLCCGDDPGENAISSKSYEGTNAYVINGIEVEYSACCGSGKTCVDETGMCRPLNYQYCVQSGGMQAVCRIDGNWDLSTNSECVSLCEICDINGDGEVDSEDLTAIDNNKEDDPELADSAYDVNNDGFVDYADSDICNENYFGQQCLYCGDSILTPEYPFSEECEIVNEVVTYQCPDYYCSGDENNNNMFERTGCSSGLCNCQYEVAGCNADNCGGCAIDSDCSNNQECDTRGCICVDYIIGGEVSVHLYETDCSYRVCFNGDETNGQIDVFTGTITTSTTFQTIRSEFFESSDSYFVDSLDNPTIINFEVEVTDGQDCINFETDSSVSYVVELNDDAMDLKKIYFETEDNNPTTIQFFFETLEPNSCRVCVPNEDIEVTIDGRDNDCDGLVDEPPFTEEGVYVWEANCEYYICVFDTKASGVLKTDEFTNLRAVDWEQDDTYTLSPDSKTIEFSAETLGLDCLAFISTSVINFDIDNEDIFIGQEHRRSLLNPFDYANPVCALNCDKPGSCGTESSVFGQMNCGPGQCLFDCGGYWIEEDSIYDYLSMFGFSYMGDYCEDCEDDMNCSNYNNEYSCHYDPCITASTRFGCYWDEESETCDDIVVPCTPGTTMCDDGFCREDCENLASCIGYPDDECEFGEGCGCEDCDNEQDSCVEGAVCSEEICGCDDGTALCVDGTCDETCEDNGGFQGCIGEPNKVCELGEGCACKDCFNQQDSCSQGLYCNFDSLCQDPLLIECGIGETLCALGVCDETCEYYGGKQGCLGLPNNLCEQYEGCACEDCYGKRDSCAEGLVCDAEDELCSDSSSGGGDDNYCVDADNDDYYKKSTRCSGSDDCDDTKSSVNPGMLEVCDGLDNNCDGIIDEGCSVETMFTIESSDKIRILDEFEFAVEVKNNQLADSKIKLEVETPIGIGAISKDNYELDLKSGSASEVKFRMYVKDYKSKTANIILRIIKGNEEFSEEIPLEIEIPKFMIAQDPSNKGEKCKDFYFVLNDNTLDDKIDMEINIVNPDAFLGKTLLVDYMSGINVNGIVVEKLLSNPYCLDYKENYEIHGSIYQASSGLVMSSGPKYIEKISQQQTNSKVKVKVNIK